MSVSFHNLRENESNSNNGIQTEAKAKKKSLFERIKNSVMPKSRRTPKYKSEGNRVGVSASNEVAIKRRRPRTIHFGPSEVQHPNGSITTESVNNQKNSGIYHRSSLPVARSRRISRGRNRRSHHNENNGSRSNILNYDSNINSNEGVGHVRRGKKGRTPELPQEIILPPSLENSATARQIERILKMENPKKMYVKGGGKKDKKNKSSSNEKGKKGKGKSIEEEENLFSYNYGSSGRKSKPFNNWTGYESFENYEENMSAAAAPPLAPRYIPPPIQYNSEYMSLFGNDSVLSSLLRHSTPSSSLGSVLNEEEEENNEYLHRGVRPEHTSRSRLRRLNQGAWFASEENPRNLTKRSVQISNKSRVRYAPKFLSTKPYKNNNFSASMHHPIGYSYETRENEHGNPVNREGNPINIHYFYNEEEINTGEKVKNKMKKANKKAGNGNN